MAGACEANLGAVSVELSADDLRGIGEAAPQIEFVDSARFVRSYYNRILRLYNLLKRSMILIN